VCLPQILLVQAVVYASVAILQARTGDERVVNFTVCCSHTPERDVSLGIVRFILRVMRFMSEFLK
jgi:hypothetical protein